MTKMKRLYSLLAPPCTVIDRLRVGFGSWLVTTPCDVDENWRKCILLASRRFLNQNFRDQTAGKPQNSEPKFREKSTNLNDYLHVSVVNFSTTKKNQKSPGTLGPNRVTSSVCSACTWPLEGNRAEFRKSL